MEVMGMGSLNPRQTVTHTLAFLDILLYLNKQL